MKTTSIIDVAQKLIRSIADNTKKDQSGNSFVFTDHIKQEARELQKWINEGKLEERITD